MEVIQAKWTQQKPDATGQELYVSPRMFMTLPLSCGSGLLQLCPALDDAWYLRNIALK
jgi:hypothetical protein